MIQFIIGSFNAILAKEIVIQTIQRSVSAYCCHMLHEWMPENIYSINYLLFYPTLPLENY